MAERYDAFISYSQSADGRMAPAVQRGLQQLARPWYGRRALWIFRDDTGLAVNAALWPAIQDALDQSAYFILLVSPAAARSQWVNKEIAHWRATKDPRRILPVLTEGEWRWDESAADFGESSAMPPALRGAFVTEPRYLDLRWARSETDLNLRNGRFRLAIASLAAPLHGKPTEDLESEDIRQFRRFARIRATVLAGLTILAVVASTLGVAAYANGRRARQEADRAVREARVAVSRQLAADAKSLAGTDLDLALLLSAEAYRTEPTLQAVDGLVSVSMNEPQLASYLHGHRSAVLALHFTGPATLLSADADGVVMSWDVRSGRGRRLAQLREAAEVVAFSNDGTLLAADETDTAQVRILPVNGGPERGFTGDDEGARALVFGPGDDVLFSGGASGSLREWNVRTGSSTSTALGDNGIHGLAVTPDGRYLAAGDIDGHVRGYDRERRRREDIQSVRGASNGLAFDRTGTRLAIRDSVNSLWLWDRKQHKISAVAPGEKVLDAETREYLTATAAVVFSPDGRSVAATAGRDAALYQLGSPRVFPGQNGRSRSITFDPTGRTVAVGSEDGTITLWSGTGDPPLARRMPGAVSHLRAIAASSDGRVVAATGCSPAAFEDLDEQGFECGAGTVTVWSDGKPRSLPSPHRNFVDALSVSPDGRFLTSGDSDGLMVRWDLGTGRYERLDLGTDGVESLATAPDGLAIVAGDLNGGVLVWDTQRRVRQVIRAGIDISDPSASVDATFSFSMTLSGDGSKVFTAESDGLLHAWDRRTGAERSIEPGLSEDVFSIAADPTRPRVYAGFRGGRVQLWEGLLDRLVSTIIVPDSTGYIAVSGDGTILAVGTEAGVQLWEIATGRRLGTRATMDDSAIEAVTFAGPRAPQQLFTASSDRLLAWDLTPESLIAHACGTANRNLTPAERAAYLPATSTLPTCPGR
ncbi:TIR domain-containing protein [Paractinoplanes toevensis]|nr:TIR domain-containing protein [Actinoplanes toevensis]